MGKNGSKYLNESFGSKYFNLILISKSMGKNGKVNMLFIKILNKLRFYEFWIKILFFFNYKNSLYLKLLSNLACLGHVGDSIANVDVLNSGFIIIFKVYVTVLNSGIKAIVVVLNNGFIILKKLKLCYH